MIIHSLFVTRLSIVALLGLTILRITPAQGDDADISASLDSIVQTYVKAKKFSGVVSLTQNGQTVYSKAYGVEDLATQVPLTQDTPFMVASLTKPFTAILILQLMEQGKISLDDPISKYLPKTQKAWELTTVRHLLSHTSGLKDYLNTDEILEPIRYKDLTPAQLIAQFSGYPLNFPSGTQQKYSNSGYVLLATILESVTGMKYSDLLSEKILKPLGMDKSGIRTETKFEAGFAHPLRLDGTKFVDGPLMNPSILFGAANLYSTLNDFGKFDQALYSEKLLSKATLEAMFTPNFDRYGLGFAIRQWEGKRVVLHNGNITGFSARISRYIDQGVSIIVLENLREAPVTEVTEKLATAYFGWAAR